MTLTLFTIPEAARELRISEKTLRRLIERKRIGTYRPSPGLLRISSAHIAEFLARSEKKARPQWQQQEA